MEMLNKDEILSIGMCLKLSDLLNFSLVNKRVNHIIEKIWIYKLNKEFEDFHILNLNSSHKEIYTLLYSLNTLKNKIELKESIYELYNIETFGFHKGMISIPKEIWSLRNLKELDLSYNIFTEIPRELFNLTKLKVLRLYSNRLRKIPKEIENLINLEFLHISDNQLKEIPKEMGRMIKLNTISLFDNKLRTLPEELNNLPDLKFLGLTGNTINYIPEILLRNEKLTIRR